MNNSVWLGMAVLGAAHLLLTIHMVRRAFDTGVSVGRLQEREEALISDVLTEELH